MDKRDYKYAARQADFFKSLREHGFQDFEHTESNDLMFMDFVFSKFSNESKVYAGGWKNVPNIRELAEDFCLGEKPAIKFKVSDVEYRSLKGFMNPQNIVFADEDAEKALDEGLAMFYHTAMVMPEEGAIYDVGRYENLFDKRYVREWLKDFGEMKNCTVTAYIEGEEHKFDKKPQERD